MYKQIVYDKTCDTKIDRDLTITLLDDVLEKTAAEQPQYILDWANTVQKEPGKTYVMVSAVGAGEYYGPNQKGDYFPEMALLSMQEADEVKPPFTSAKIRYKTFEDAKFYRHHRNKPTDPSFGEVASAFWDDRMHKVVLIIAINDKDAPDIVQELRDGKIMAVSMGCKVPYDVCSICGNKASKRSDYCKHLTTQMNHILEDGRKVFAINTKPRFFDISYVTRPAWLGGWEIMKVAGLDAVQTSAELAELKKTAFHDKTGEIFKSDDLPIISVIRNVSLREPTIPQAVLDELSRYPKPMIWGALLRKGMLPKPSEFAYLMLKDDQPTIASAILQKPLVFDPCVEAEDTEDTDIRPTNLDELFDPEFVKLRSFLSPDLEDRLGAYLTKEASIIMPVVIGLGLATLYKALRGKFSIAVLGAGAAGARAGDDLFGGDRGMITGTATPEDLREFLGEKTAGIPGSTYTAIGAFTAPYIYTAYAKKRGKSNLITKHPGMTGVGMLALHQMARKMIR